MNVGVIDLPVGPVHCARDPLPFWKCKFCIEYVTPVGPVHYSQYPQISFFNNFFIKIWSHGTIYTFKNYFATVFLVFSKISSIQTDPKLILKMCILINPLFKGRFLKLSYFIIKIISFKFLKNVYFKILKVKISLDKFWIFIINLLVIFLLTMMKL